MKPATEREIAVELQKLRAVFGYEETAWKVAAPLYFEVWADIPADLLAEAVGNYVRMAGADDRFPKPGQIRALLLDSLENRKAAVRREDYQASRAAGREEWPKWLEELWGPLPDGPRKRNEAIAEQQARYAAARAWRDAVGSGKPPSAPPPPHLAQSPIAAAQIAAGLSATLRPEEEQAL